MLLDNKFIRKNKKNCFILVEVAAEMGLGGTLNSAISSGGMPNQNQMLMQSIQALIAANPAFLTGGIPTKLLSQIWTEPHKVIQAYTVRIFSKIQYLCIYLTYI